MNIMSRFDLRLLTKDVQISVNEATKTAMKRVGVLVAQGAKTRVPVRTGKLRDSIKSTVRKRYRASGYQTTIKTGKGDKGYRYGLDVEIGRPGGGYANTPYIRPTFEVVAPTIPSIVKDAVEVEARKQQRRRGRPRKSL